MWIEYDLPYSDLLARAYLWLRKKSPFDASKVELPLKSRCRVELPESSSIYRKIVSDGQSLGMELNPKLQVTSEAKSQARLRLHLKVRADVYYVNLATWLSFPKRDRSSCDQCLVRGGAFVEDPKAVYMDWCGSYDRQVLIKCELSRSEDVWTKLR